MTDPADNAGMYRDRLSVLLFLAGLASARGRMLDAVLGTALECPNVYRPRSRA
jgi:hypothetical protein